MNIKRFFFSTAAVLATAFSLVNCGGGGEVSEMQAPTAGQFAAGKQIYITLNAEDITIGAYGGMPDTPIEDDATSEYVPQYTPIEVRQCLGYLITSAGSQATFGGMLYTYCANNCAKVELHGSQETQYITEGNFPYILTALGFSKDAEVEDDEDETVTAIDPYTVEIYLNFTTRRVIVNATYWVMDENDEGANEPKKKTGVLCSGIILRYDPHAW